MRMPQRMRTVPMPVLLVTGRARVCSVLAIAPSVHEPDEHKRDTDAGDPAAEQKHGFHERSLSITEPITRSGSGVPPRYTRFASLRRGGHRAAAGWTAPMAASTLTEPHDRHFMICQQC